MVNDKHEAVHYLEESFVQEIAQILTGYAAMEHDPQRVKQFEQLSLSLSTAKYIGFHIIPNKEPKQ